MNSSAAGAAPLLRALLFNVLFFGWTGLLCVLGLPLLALPRVATVRYARLWLRATLAMLAGVVGLRHELRGAALLPAGPAILAVKHQSAWETMALNLLFPDPAFVLKRELYWIPFFGWYLARSGQIALDRSAGAGAMKKMLRLAKEVAAAGRRIVIFPEGTRVAPGETRIYQPGIAGLYGALGLPVVPVALNSGVFWRRRGFLKRPGTIVVEVLPAIPPGLKREEFMARLETSIETATAKLVDEARRNPR